MKTHWAKRLFLALFGVAFLLAVAASVYYYMQYRKLTQGQRELNTLKKTLEQFMVLPDENPTLATVTEKEKLQSQPFFKSAENGDKVLIFTTARKAILYRPSMKKIIDVSPIQFLSSETQQAEEQVNTHVRIAIYNGTTTAGATNTIEATIKKTYADVTISGKSAAVKETYEKTIVVDLTGKNSTLAAQFATLLKGEIGALPDGEKKPDADVLILVGQQSL